MAQLLDDISNDPATSDWLKAALQSALERDPVDAVNDAQILHEALQENLAALMRTHDL